MPRATHEGCADSRVRGVSLWGDERTRRGHPRWQCSTNRKLQEAAARYHVVRLAKRVLHEAHIVAASSHPSLSRVKREFDNWYTGGRDGDSCLSHPFNHSFTRFCPVRVAGTWAADVPTGYVPRGRRALDDTAEPRSAQTRAPSKR